MNSILSDENGLVNKARCGSPKDGSHSISFGIGSHALWPKRSLTSDEQRGSVDR